MRYALRQTRRGPAGVVDEVVAANPRAVDDYRRVPVLGFVGRSGEGDPRAGERSVVQSAVRERLERGDVTRAARHGG